MIAQTAMRRLTKVGNMVGHGRPFFVHTRQNAYNMRTRLVSLTTPSLTGCALCPSRLTFTAPRPAGEHNVWPGPPQRWAAKENN